MRQLNAAIGRVPTDTLRPSSKFEVCLCPIGTKDSSGMKSRKYNDRDSNHSRFENHEQDFVVGEGTVESFLQLGNAVDGADIDCQGCNGDGWTFLLVYVVGKEVGNVPARKALNFIDLANNSKYGFRGALFCFTFQVNHAHTIANKVKLTTWNTKPAIMMLTPVCESFCVSAADAIPPPAPCRTKETKSQIMKVMV